MDNLTPITREEMLLNDEPLTPITREEKILAGEDLECVTRREYFLKKYRHAGGDVMVEGLEVTANGTYTAPEGKAYSPVEVAVPLPDNAYLLKTASGSLVSFSDGADLPMPSFVCNIDAVQDLHGYDAPWVGGAGKNKLANVLSELKSNNTSGTWSGNVYTINGGTIEILTDTADNILGYKVNGTFTGTSSLILAETAYKLLSDFANNSNFVISQEVEGSGANGFCLQRQEAGSNIYIPNNQNYTTVNPSSDTTNHYRPILRFNNGDSIANKTYVLMIRNSADSSDFAPYSNICPISGHTGVDAWLRGKNLANPATVTTLYPTGDSGTYPNQIRNSSNASSVIAEVAPNTTYTISKKAGQRFRVAFTAEEPAVGVADYGYTWQDTGTTITVTSPSNAKYIIVLFYSSNADTDTMETILATLQIELGETATTYEPYNPNSQTVQVSWQTEAGEVFGGYVDLVSGVLTVTHKEITYDGVTSNKKFSVRVAESRNVYYSTIPDGFDFNTTGRVSSTDMKKYGMINSHYDYTDDQSVGFYTSVSTAGYLQPRILFGTDSDITTVELANQWLATQYANGTPWQVVYPLATPITYQLTPHQIKSLLGNNNAWCDTGDVDIDYFAKEVTG